ncbi:MAG: 5-carboxymethyl-2-hydroxymuconate Delta-isomerase [Pseudomonadota bacterium]|nr:5-carboxymethyl-2-hydroxymuconate Delta-isomerase [Pseudomonadota bacterium]
MPHFVIEYAREVESQINLPELLEVTHQVGTNSGLMKPEDIKVRARPYDHYRMVGANDTFVHTTIFLLEGRTDEQKEKLSIALRTEQAKLMPDVTAISIDIRDMNDIAYKKRLLPSEQQI